MEEMIEISKKEYERLKAKEAHYDHLRYTGVDNWEGYSWPDTEDEED